MSPNDAASCALAFEQIDPNAADREQRAAEQAAGRRAVRRAVRKLVGPRHTVTLAYPPRRAPSGRLENGERIWISLSHRDGWAVAACSRAPIGVDLERASPIADDAGNYFLSDAERRDFDELPLLTLWSLKEAAWKALELSDDVSFHSLVLRGTNQRLSGLEVGGHVHRAIGSIQNPAPGWVMSLVQLERSDS